MARGLDRRRSRWSTCAIRRVRGRAGRFRAREAAGLMGTHDVQVDGSGLAWVAGGNGTAAYDVSDPVHPQLVRRTNRRGSRPPLNNFIHHNSLRLSRDVVAITEEAFGRGCRRAGHAPDVADLAAAAGCARSTRSASSATARARLLCSAHYFDARDGLIAQGFYEQGVRLIDARAAAAAAPGRLLRDAAGPVLGRAVRADRPDRLDRVRARPLARDRRAGARPRGAAAGAAAAARARAAGSSAGFAHASSTAGSTPSGPASGCGCDVSCLGSRRAGAGAGDAAAPSWSTSARRAARASTPRRGRCASRSAGMRGGADRFVRARVARTAALGTPARDDRLRQRGRTTCCRSTTASVDRGVVARRREGDLGAWRRGALGGAVSAVLAV